MGFLETGQLCSLEVYNNHRQERVAESDLEVDGLYVYMMYLDTSDRLAALQPARIESMQKVSGFVIVRFAFLDEDLIPSHIEDEAVNDGIVSVSENAVFAEYATGQDFPVQEAYLRDYFEEQFGQFLAEARELALV